MLHYTTLHYIILYDIRLRQQGRPLPGPGLGDEPAQGPRPPRGYSILYSYYIRPGYFILFVLREAIFFYSSSGPRPPRGPALVYSISLLLLLVICVYVCIYIYIYIYVCVYISLSLYIYTYNSIFDVILYHVYVIQYYCIVLYYIILYYIILNSIV